MKLRHPHRWIAWLLPLFMLRAFMPAGYMLAVSADGLQVVVCTGVGQAAVVATPHLAPPGHGEHGAHGAHSDSAAHVGHAQHAPPFTDDSSQHDDPSALAFSLCVFAVGGTANVSAPQTAALFDTSLDDSPIDFIADPELNSLPILIDRIRGPPSA